MFIKIKGLEVFMEGEWNGYEYTRKHIDEMAKGYDPVNEHEAVFVKGHQGLFLPADDPKYGTINKVYAITRKGKRILVVDGKLHPELFTLIMEEKYTKRSIFLTRNYRGTKKAYLLHVGWLGASEPAVKGLLDNYEFDVFSHSEDNAALITIDASLFENRELPGTIFSVENKEKNEEGTLQKEETHLNKEDKKMDKELQLLKEQMDEMKSAMTKKDQEIADLNSKLAEKDKSIDTLNSEQLAAENRAFLKSLNSEGKIPAALTDGMDLFLSSLNDEQEMKFKVNDSEVKKTPAAYFKDFLSKLPEVVTFNEVATEDTAGESVPAGNIDFHSEVKKYAQEHGITDHAEAVRLYIEEHPEAEYKE